MRYLRYLFLALLAVCLVILALANREPVTLQILGDGIAGWAPLERFGIQNSIELPLFIVIFSSIVAGLLIGFVWEWLREHKHRRVASVKAREVDKLEREVVRLKGERNQNRDEVLAILDEAS